MVLLAKNYLSHVRGKRHRQLFRKLKEGMTQGSQVLAPSSLFPLINEILTNVNIGSWCAGGSIGYETV